MEGNALWAVLGWLCRLSLVGKLMATLLSVFALWLSVLTALPWPVVTFCVVAFVFLVGVFLTTFCKIEIVPDAPIKVSLGNLVLELTPHSESSTEVCLEVKNIGDVTVVVSADLRLTHRSDRTEFKRMPYCGQWRGAADTERIIEVGRSAFIRVGTINPDREFGMAELSLAGLDEQLFWVKHPEPCPDKFESLTVEVIFFASGCAPLEPTSFNIGPIDFYNRVRMTEVTT